MKSSVPIDPATIREKDKVKLIALYGRVCPNDVLTSDDPRRDCIAAEMLDIGLANSSDSALQVIAWWDPLIENLKPIVASVRRSFRNLKLEGHYRA
ncbi:hypothetical protein JAB5_27560 [Janthinobacterium sp. HH103]|uniref:hypothetical protein n=1 Tax=unclassified Janthinobacterium TaxID=2610881 RepID=UPI0008740934|nr:MULTISPECIES: hypothetical protein [unclassified Janthinobacterium]OEZ52998.1 hypothetical protein JAB2_58620 [Janthinobacterium sp. HH100]OEZ76447.1 hypothetical protein JAB5_27560 [Janthinobacterium sp. HH103]QOU76185.1 hypothetical protein JAB4_056850 [Janthinobacterium sp. HH102]